MALKKLLNAQEVATLFGKPVHAIWRGAREGWFPFTVRISASCYRFDPDGIAEFLKQGGSVNLPLNSPSEDSLDAFDYETHIDQCRLMNGATITRYKDKWLVTTIEGLQKAKKYKTLQAAIEATEELDANRTI